MVHRQHILKGPEILDGKRCGKKTNFLRGNIFCELILICGSTVDVFCNFGFHDGKLRNVENKDAYISHSKCSK